jgi:uncharacterized protein (DUF433 family)
MSFNYHPYITRNPEICGGEPVIAETRVPLRTVLAFAAASAEEDLPLAADPAFA